MQPQKNQPVAEILNIHDGFYFIVKALITA